MRATKRFVTPAHPPPRVPLLEVARAVRVQHAHVICAPRGTRWLHDEAHNGARHVPIDVSDACVWRPTVLVPLDADTSSVDVPPADGARGDEPGVRLLNGPRCSDRLAELDGEPGCARGECSVAVATSTDMLAPGASGGGGAVRGDGAGGADCAKMRRRGDCDACTLGACGAGCGGGGGTGAAVRSDGSGTAGRVRGESALPGGACGEPGGGPMTCPWLP